MTGGDGKPRTPDEIALHLWHEDGIARERFYYDPAQMRPAG